MSDTTQTTGDINNSSVSDINQLTYTENVQYSKEPSKNVYNTSVKCLIRTCVIVSILSLVLNIVLVGCKFPRRVSEDNLVFDYIGIIVGIFALLVTVLMAWNIFAIIDIKGIEMKVHKYIDKELRNIGDNVMISAMCYADVLSVDDYMKRKIPHVAVDFLFMAIDSCKGRLYGDSVINSAITNLYVICCEYHKGELVIYKGKRFKYIDTLSLFKGNRIDEIIKAISNAQEIENCKF